MVLCQLSGAVGAHVHDMLDNIHQFALQKRLKVRGIKSVFS